MKSNWKILNFVNTDDIHVKDHWNWKYYFIKNYKVQKPKSINFVE